MAIFLREQGIPARIVEGFLPGERDRRRARRPISNSQSHQWVEVYFPGYGWVLFDPTGGERRQAAGPAVRVRRSPARARPLPSIALPSRLGDSEFRDPDERHRRRQPRRRNNVGRRRSSRSRSCSRSSSGVLAFVAWQRGPRGGTTADHAYRTVTRLASRFGFGPRPTQTVYEFAGEPRRGPADRPARARDRRAGEGRDRLRPGVLGEDRLQALRDAERRLRVNLLRLAFRRRERRRRR